MIENRAFYDVLPLQHHEMGQSYLGRVAAYNFYESSLEFCKDFSLDRRGILCGEPDALTRLAAVAGVDENEVIRWTPLRVGKNVFRLANEEHHSNYGGGFQAVIECPLCVREQIATQPHLPPDLAIYGRAELFTGFFQACPKHGVKLFRSQQRAISRNVAKYDASYNRTRFLDDILETPIVKMPDSTFESFAFARLNGFDVAQSDIIHGLTLPDLYAVTTALGTDLHRHVTGHFEEREYRDAGTDILMGGWGGLHRLLEAIRSDLKGRTRVRDALPRLIKLLGTKRRGDPLSTFRGKFARLLFDVFPYGPADKVLRQSPTTRRLHTMHSASESYQIDKGLLNKMAIGIPGFAVRYTGKWADTIIDTTIADKILAGRGPFITGHALQQRVMEKGNRCHAPGKDLADAGLVIPVVDPSIMGRYLFSQEEVETRLEKVKQRLPVFEGEQVGFVRLATALAFAAMTRSALLREIFEGRLSCGVLAGARLLDGIRVEVRSLNKLLFGTEEAMTIFEAARRLRIHRSALSRLVASGQLPAFPSNPHLQSRRPFAIRPQDIDEFQGTYLTLHEIWRLRGYRISRDQLANIGLFPVIYVDGPPKMCLHFYRRADVERLGI